MPPVVDATVSRNTYLGSDDATQATRKKGLGGIVSRNSKRIFDFEANEMQDMLFNESRKICRDLWADGVFTGNVFGDGVNRNSYVVTYGAGVLAVAAGRARLSGFQLDLISDATSGNVPGLTSFALPAAGHIQVIYIDIYDREVECNGSNPYVDATTSSNGNDPYLATPLGEMQRRYQYFNYRTDITFALDTLPSPVAGHSYMQIATVDSTGAVTDSRVIALFNIVDGSVTAAKLASSAVTTVKIADGAVVTAKLADASVSTAKIIDLNVTTAKIADGAIITVKIADSSVTTAKIADAAVIAQKLADGAVVTSKIAPANVTLSTLAAEVLAFLLPTGCVIPYGGTSAPAGFLMCDGSSVLRSAYPALFAIIGTSFGSVDGTTFNLPNLRGRFIRGVVNTPTTTGSGTAGSNNATFTGHPYKQTGVKVRLASGTLTGLAASTDYFVIVIDANTLSFASTRANAIGSTKLPISGANSAVITEYEDPDAAAREASTSNGASGDAVGSLQEDAFQSHAHGNTFEPNANHGGAGGSDTPQTTYLFTHVTDSQGGNETRPLNIGMNHLIKI